MFNWFIVAVFVNPVTANLLSPTFLPCVLVEKNTDPTGANVGTALTTTVVVVPVIAVAELTVWLGLTV